MAKDNKNLNGANAKEAESKILVDSDNASNNNVNPPKDGDSDRNEVRADKVDRICEIGEQLSQKVLKKIESKDYLKENLKRKENVSYETSTNQKENDEQKSVLFNSFVVFAFICAVILYVLSRILGKKSQKTSQYPPFENADIFARGDTSEQNTGENDSLADSILMRAGDK